MSFGEFMALAVVVGGTCAIFAMLTEAYKARMRVRERELELRLAQPARVEPDLADAKPAKIEERLRVLERIATDRKHMLADEIEALRGDLEKAQ